MKTIAARDRAYRFLHDNILLCLLSVYALAAIFPKLGVFLRGITVVSSPDTTSGFKLPMLMLSLLLFNAGLSCKTGQIHKLARSGHVLLLGVGANFLIPLAFTLAFAGVGHVWHNNDEIQNILLGLAIVASMPIAGSSAAWVQNAGGNPALILGLVVLSTMVSPLSTPLVFHLISKVTVGDYSEDLSEMASTGTGGFLALSVVIPSLLGMGARRLLGEERYQRVLPYSRLANLVNLLLLNYVNASTALPHALAKPDFDFLALIAGAVFLLCVMSFVLGWFLPQLFRVSTEDRIALMFGLGMNNNGTGLVLASLALADHPAVMLPIVFYNLGQQIIAGLFQSALHRQGIAAA